LVSFANFLGTTIPFDSGYVSIAACWQSEALMFEASGYLAGVALRHPGLDINFNQSTAYNIELRCRGPHWITLLGPRLLAKLGGKETFLKRLGVLPCAIDELAHGVSIRTGAIWDIGDRNRQIELLGLRALAKAIEPVTFFGDTTIETYIFRHDDDRFAQWDKRHIG
jgi:hypothetical protein